MEYITFIQLVDVLYHHYILQRGNSIVGLPSHLFMWKLGVCIRFLARAECSATLKHLFRCCSQTIRGSIVGVVDLINNHIHTIQINIEDQPYLEHCRNKKVEHSQIDGYAFIIDGTHYPLLKAPANVDGSNFLTVKDGNELQDK